MCIYIYKVSIILCKYMRVYLKVHISLNVCIFIQIHMYMFANVGCKLKGLVGLVSLEEIPFSNQVSKTAGASSLSQDWVILAPVHGRSTSQHFELVVWQNLHGQCKPEAHG